MALEGLGEPELTKDGQLAPLVNHGLPCMSMGFLVPQDSNTAVVWRGLMVQKAAQQLLFDVDWRGQDSSQSGLDVLVVDMPPGTGDVALTLGQLVEVSGAVIVSTPQDVALIDAQKGIAMFRKVSVPILGTVLNMAYYTCHDCKPPTRHYIFGPPDSFVKTTNDMGAPLLGQLPLIPSISSGGDRGVPALLISESDGSTDIASSQVQAESPKTPMNATSLNMFETRPEQATENTFYKRLRIDVIMAMKMSISPANRDVCLASRKGLFIIDLENPYDPPRFIPQGGTWAVADVQWNPHPARSNLICSTSSQKLLVWDLNMPGQNAIQRRLHAHYRAITDINWHSFTPDVVSSCGIADQAASGFWTKAGADPQDFAASATQVKWNRQDPHLLASAHDTSLLIWDDRHGSVPLYEIPAHESRIYGIDWSRKHRDEIVSCSLDKKIKLWNINLDPRDKTKPTPQNEIETQYPVWRARNLPFGDGVLALPQRGMTALEMFAFDTPSEKASPHVPRGAKLAITFEGHKDAVKEYVWRAAGGLDAGCDDREFQLVTWSKDNTLRLWPIEPQTMQDCGHIPGSPIKVLMPRRGAANETYRIPPSTTPSTPVTPSLSAPLGPRNALSNVKATPHAPHPPHRNPSQTRETKTKGTGFMTRGARVSGMDPMLWMSSVKVERDIDSGQNSMLGSRATSVERVSQPHMRSERSLSRSGDFEEEGDAEDLADEVNKSLGNKVKFIKTDVSKKRMCTVSLNGPWGESGPAFIRITFHFPPEYPRSLARSAIPTIELEKSPEINLKDRAYILRRLRKIRLHTRPCLDPCLRFLLGMSDVHGRSLGPRGIDSGSDSSDEGEQRQSRSGLVSHLSNHADNVPMPRRCQGVFGPNGELVCFFPMAPSIVSKNERTPSPSVGSRGTGPGSASRIRPFAPSAIVSHALRGLSQLSVDKPSSLVDQPRPKDAANALRFSDHLFARTSMSRSKHSDSVNSWNSNNKPSLTASSHSFVVIKNLSSMIQVDRSLAGAYVTLAKNPAAMCRANAEIARTYARHDHERIWKILATLLQHVVPLHHGLQGDAKTAALRNFEEKKQISIEEAYKGVQWGHNPLARQTASKLYTDLSNLKDVQMLAMLSIVLLSADIAAGPRVRVPRRDLNTLGIGSAPIRISIDYFSLRKRPQRQAATESPTWPKSTSIANLSPASQSLSSSGNSKHSWHSYLNSRFRLGSMPDLQAAINASTKTENSSNPRTGAGMRLLNAVVSIPVPGGGRLTSSPAPPPAPAPATSEAVKRRQSVMSTATLDSSVSGKAPSDISSGRLSVHFNAPHRRSSMVARAPPTKPLYSSKLVSVGYRPAEHDEEDLWV
ncbi:cytosolic Fe-S cluster assembly factor NBP35 [Ceratobasidium sp. AG-Ba]|nr:cytosolic Fe-S cluster assembly factor NBP35 [Ceratobasidium sp. AG-Ba]